MITKVLIALGVLILLGGLGDVLKHLLGVNIHLSITQILTVSIIDCLFWGVYWLYAVPMIKGLL